MRLVDRLRTSVGSVALAGTLLLTSPGITVVHAEEAVDLDGPAAGLICEAGQSALDANAEIQSYLEQLRRQSQGASEISADGSVALNNRGFNYGPAPTIDTGRVLMEAQRQRP